MILEEARRSGVSLDALSELVAMFVEPWDLVFHCAAKHLVVPCRNRRRNRIEGQRIQPRVRGDFADSGAGREIGWVEVSSSR